MSEEIKRTEEAAEESSNFIHEFIKEDMVAGDSGGNPENISTGTTSGAVVNKGPEQIPKKKKEESKEKEE